MKTVLVAVIVSMLIGVSLFGITSANPSPPNYTGPSVPDKSLPKIDISLPENNTSYNNKDVLYYVTIFKPSSWFDYSSPWNGQLFSVSYSLDNGAEVTIAMKEFDSYESLTSRAPITLQGTLTGLHEGNHTFQIFVYGVSYYQDPHAPGIPANYYVRNNSTANFSINTAVSPTLEPQVTPTETQPIANTNVSGFRLTNILFVVAVAILIVVAIVVSVYLGDTNQGILKVSLLS